MSFSYGPMNVISNLDGIQTNYGSRAGQVAFRTEADFRAFNERILAYGARVCFVYNIVSQYNYKAPWLRLQGPVVLPIVSLTSSLRVQLIKCFTTL